MDKKELPKEIIPFWYGHAPIPKNTSEFKEEKISFPKEWSDFLSAIRKGNLL